VTDRDLLGQIEDLGADTVYFIRGADGLWQAHVRHAGAGPSRYALSKGRTIRSALTALLEEPDIEIEDLI